MGCIALSLEEVHSRHSFSPTTNGGVARRASRTQGVEPRSQRAMPVLGAPCDRGEPHDLRVGELERAGLTEEHFYSRPVGHRELRLAFRRDAGECEREKE